MILCVGQANPPRGGWVCLIRLDGVRQQSWPAAAHSSVWMRQVRAATACGRLRRIAAARSAARAGAPYYRRRAYHCFGRKGSVFKQVEKQDARLRLCLFLLYPSRRWWTSKSMTAMRFRRYSAMACADSRVATRCSAAESVIFCRCFAWCPGGRAAQKHVVLCGSWSCRTAWTFELAGQSVRQTSDLCWLQCNVIQADVRLFRASKIPNGFQMLLEWTSAGRVSLISSASMVWSAAKSARRNACSIQRGCGPGESGWFAPGSCPAQAGCEIHAVRAFAQKRRNSA